MWVGENPGAGFISMIMDRLHALETENDAIKKQVADLRKEMEQHQQALHLTRHFTAFSDGFAFYPGFTKDTDAMWPKTSKIGDDTDLDELHLDATATFGPMQVHVQGACWHDTILIGEPGELAARITVRQLLDAVNAWCSSPTDNGKTKADRYICGQNLWPTWGGLRCLPFDEGSQRYAYQLVLSSP